MKDRDIIFFDAECNLCDHFIRFVLKRDKKKQFLYAPLQGVTAQNHLKPEDIQTLKSIVFFKKGQTLKEAQAIKSLMKELYPKGAFLLKIFPGPFFNFFYRFISKRRYRIFGKKSQIYKAKEEGKEYFLP